MKAKKAEEKGSDDDSDVGSIPADEFGMKLMSMVQEDIGTFI